MARPLRDDHLLWKESARELLRRCAVFDLYRSARVPLSAPPDTAAADFYLLDARDWVTVVPVVSDAEGKESFLMVRQYRHGIERLTLEFPAGLVEPGERPEEAARRELLEETGHEAQALAHCATMGSAPAFMTNWCHVYVAWKLAPARAQELDETERLDVVSLPLAEVEEGFGSGELLNSITAMSYFFYLRWARGASAGRRNG